MVSSHPETCNEEMTSVTNTSTLRIQAPSQPTSSAQLHAMHTLTQHAPTPCPHLLKGRMPLTVLDATTQPYLASASQCDTLVQACFASTFTPSIATSYCQMDSTSVQRCHSYWPALPSIRAAMLMLLCISTTVHCGNIGEIVHQHKLAKSKVQASETWDPNSMCVGAGLHGRVKKTATGDLVPLLFSDDQGNIDRFVRKKIPIYSSFQACHP